MASRRVGRKWRGTEPLFHASRIGSTSSQAASTLSARSNSVASPRMQSLMSVAYASRDASPKACAITKVHGNRADLHLSAGSFRAKRQRNPFLRLNIQHQPVGLKIVAAEYHVRRILESNSHFGPRLGQPLARPQIKGHTAPSPVVDKQLQRYVSFGCRIGVHAFFLGITGDRSPVRRSRPILPAHHRI